MLRRLCGRTECLAGWARCVRQVTGVLGGMFDNQTGAHSISEEDLGQTEQRASLSPDAVDPPLASAPGRE